MTAAPPAIARPDAPAPAPAPGRRDTRARRRRRRRENLPLYIAISPFYLLFAVFGLFPILFSIVLSFTDWDGMGEISFVGLAQYQFLVTDDRFWNAVGNTFIIWILSTVPMLFLAMAIAFLLHQNIRFTPLYRVAFFLPNVTSMVAMAIVFGSVFSDTFGLVNSAMTALGLDAVPWLSSPWGIKITIAAMVIWRFTGYNAIIYLAGLQSIPTDLYDAAKVDGANLAQVFFRITVPMLRPIILFTVITSTIAAEPVHRAAGSARERGRRRRGRHDDRAVPVQPGVHPVRLRLRLRHRLGTLPHRRGLRHHQLAPGLRAR